MAAVIPVHSIRHSSHSAIAIEFYVVVASVVVGLPPLLVADPAVAASPIASVY